MAGRPLTLAVDSAIAATHVEAALLVSLDFPSGSVRINTTDESIAWSGNTYLGAAAVSGIEPIEESTAATAAALNLRFSGISSSYLTAILSDQYQGRTASIHVALFDPTTLALLSDPVLVFSGRMDEPLVTLGETATIQLSLENRLADWDRARIRRYNHADQAARYSGDLFFEFVEELQSKDVMWGIFKGPPAPDPLKLLNRTIDKVVSKVPIPGLKQQVNVVRNLGDKIANIFGW